MVRFSPKSPNLQGMDITIDFNNMMADTLGPENGISEAEIEECSKEIIKPNGLHERFQKMREQGDLAFTELPYDTQTVNRIKSLAENVRDQFDNFVLLGIGGSALGPLAIHHALAPPYYNILDAGDRGGCPRMFFCDNIDPKTMFSLMHFLDLERTVFNVVSKSGSTTETVSQFLVIREHLKKRLGPAKMKDHLIITTDPQKGDLRSVCNRDDYEGLLIPSDVGGRFSCLSAVGLFPAIVAGIDIDGILWGAHAMDQRCQRKSVWENPAYVGSVLQFLADTKHGKKINVFMPYSDSLSLIGDWFCQLWAESLGKKGQGQTPVKARGVTDQHSQLQLYLEGPNDKVITFINVQKFLEEYPIPKTPPDLQKYSSFEYLGGQTLGKLLHSERLATESSLTFKKLLNLTYHLPLLCAETLGQLLFFLEIKTAFAGLLYEVNPFDQPAVELGKQLTYHLMGRKGFEKQPSQLLDPKQKLQKYII